MSSFVGEATGPTFGSVLTEHHNFRIACIATSIMNICYAVIMAIMSYKIIISQFSKTEKDKQVNGQDYDTIYSDEKKIIGDEITNIINDDKSFIYRENSHLSTSLEN